MIAKEETLNKSLFYNPIQEVSKYIYPSLVVYWVLKNQEISLMFWCLHPISVNKLLINYFTSLIALLSIHPLKPSVNCNFFPVVYLFLNIEFPSWSITTTASICGLLLISIFRQNNRWFFIIVMTFFRGWQINRITK
jgi:hypothetical protein